MDLISVIVPVYNVEKYLDRCVQSIVDQTYQNLEIILVDDGSSDNCPAMCDAWAAKDTRIKVIHKENGGGAQARNIGMNRANGQLIGFVDSDDFIHPEMYRYLYRILRETQSDIAECGFVMTDGNADFPDGVHEEEPLVLGTEEAMQENIRDRICRQLLWNKLYKRETVGDIRMVEGKTIDDEFFTYRVLAQAKRVAVGNLKLYAYRQQSGSVMHQSYSTKWLGAVEAKKERLLLVQERFPALAGEAGVNLVFTCLYHGQLSMRYLPEAQKQQTLRWLKKIVSGVSFGPNHLSMTHKFWLWFAKRNFALGCKVRNSLGVGL